jgi:hypothetical protein
VHINHLFRAIVDKLNHASERERDELLALVDEVAPLPEADAPDAPDVPDAPAAATLTKGK